MGGGRRHYCHWPEASHPRLCSEQGMRITIGRIFRVCAATSLEDKLAKSPAVISGGISGPMRRWILQATVS